MACKALVEANPQVDMVQDYRNDAETAEQINARDALFN